MSFKKFPFKSKHRLVKNNTENKSIPKSNINLTLKDRPIFTQAVKFLNVLINLYQKENEKQKKNS